MYFIISYREIFMNSRSGRSLLGIPERTTSMKLQSEELFQMDNDKKVEALHRTVGRIKKVSKDIELVVRESNRLVDDLVRLIA